jgi:hypothetical protein
MVFSEKHSVAKFYRKKITCKMLRINALLNEKFWYNLKKNKYFPCPKKKYDFVLLVEKTSGSWKGSFIVRLNGRSLT